MSPAPRDPETSVEHVMVLPEDEALSAVARIAAAGGIDVLAAVAARATRRSVRKAAGRAVHQLRTKGFRQKPVPRTARHGAVDAEELPEAAVTPVDSLGDRLLWLPLGDVDVPGRICLFATVLRDAREVIRCDLAEGLGRTAYRREMDAMADRDLPVVEVPRAYARWLVEEAAQAHRRDLGTPPDPYGTVRPLLGESPAAPDAHPAYQAAAVTPGGAGARGERLAKDTIMLWDDPYFAGWRPTLRAMQELLAALEALHESSLFIDAAQRMRAHDDAIDEAVTAFFDVRARSLFVRRLQDNAYLAAREGRRETAQTALANAALLADPDVSPLQCAFASQYFRRNLHIPPPPDGEDPSSDPRNGERRSPGGIILP